jgi:dienelactone hydrolase
MKLVGSSGPRVVAQWLAAALLVAAAAAAAQPAALDAEVEFVARNGVRYQQVNSVRARFETPTNGASAPWPAIVILHGSGGIDGRGQFHAQALRAAGMATLEVFMFEPGQRPRAGYGATYPHLFGSLAYLARRDDIDKRSLGVMGFSWGGGLALRAASRKLLREFGLDGPDGASFAAHVSFYPVCWIQQRMVDDPKYWAHGTLGEMTEAPILLLAGLDDDYDQPDSCRRFVDRLEAPKRSRITLQEYRDATHGWDSQGAGPSSFYDENAFLGRGGRVRFFANKAVALESREMTVKFFLNAFSASRNAVLKPSATPEAGTASSGPAQPR